MTLSNVKQEEQNLLILKGKEINLTKLGIDFKLNSQQEEVLNKIADFLINKDMLSFTMSGYAGTGKSSIVKILLKWIRQYFGWSYDFQITAPTNRAKYVIESLSGQDSMTLHSILGLLPNVNIEKLNMRTLKFDTKKPAQIPNNLLIIDESSMVNDVLLDTIISKCESKKCQIIFIGDKAQLKPVDQKHISNVFKLENRYELTKVERQKDGNPILDVLTEIRSNPLVEEPPFKFSNLLSDKGDGLVFTETSSDFLEKAVEAVKNVVFYTDYLHARILTFTNARVALYNKVVRQKLGFVNEYHKGELLMAYNNVGADPRIGEKGLINSCDYIIENDPVIEERTIAGIEVLGYRVNLVSTDIKQRLTQFILTRDNSKELLEDLAFAIEEIRYAAIYAKNRQERITRWNEYYAILKAFLTPVDLTVDGRVVITKSIDYGIAFTTHKSQGGTFNEVFVDYRDYLVCQDVEQRNQLLYVGLSRCTNKATIFH